MPSAHYSAFDSFFDRQRSSLLHITRFIAMPPARTTQSSSHTRSRCLLPRALLVYTITAATQGAAARCATIRFFDSLCFSSNGSGIATLPWRAGPSPQAQATPLPRSRRPYHLVPRHAPLHDCYRRHCCEPYSPITHCRDSQRQSLQRRCRDQER